MRMTLTFISVHQDSPQIFLLPLYNAKSWMDTDFFNPDKPEILLVSTKTLPEFSIDIDGITVKPSLNVHKSRYCIIFENTFSFESHVRSLTTDAFYKLCNTAWLWLMVSLKDDETLVYAFITSHLDVQCFHSAPSATLIRLPVSQRTKYKFLLLT